MEARNPGRGGRRYDREYLLSEEKRNQVLELWEVEQYGLDSYGDADYVCVYGMRPAEWHRRGVRLLARTTVECVRDRLGESIGRDVARVVQGAPSATETVILDPFAGSCNSLYWLLRLVRGSTGIACERDPTVFALTRHNILLLDRKFQLIEGDYRAMLRRYTFPPGDLLIVFVAPPWGDALDALRGLDLRRTQPPVVAIVEEIERAYAANPILYVTQVLQTVEPASLAELRARFAWAELRIYDINREGMKPGVLLGTSRWTPTAAAAPPSP